MAKKKEAKGKKQVKNKRPSKAWEKYKVNGGKLNRAKTCIKCGPGYFLAEHKDRWYCGKCHYVEFKSKKVEAPKEEKKGTKAPVASKPVVEGKPEIKEKK